MIWREIFVVLLPLSAFGQISLPQQWLPAGINIPGDVMIGMTKGITKLGSDGLTCTSGIDAKSVEIVEVASHLVRQINANSSILGGIQLGFTAFTDCETEVQDIVRITNFLPSPAQNPTRYITVLCCSKSDRTHTVNVMLQSYGIPQMSFKNSFEETSQSTPNRYLIQTASTEQMKLKVVIDILLYFGWNSILVLTTADQAGFDLLTRLKVETQGTPVCIMNFIPISSETPSPADFLKVIDELQKHDTVNAVLLLFYKAKNGIVDMFNAFANNNVTRKAVWILPNTITAPDRTVAQNYGMGLIRISERVKPVGIKEVLTKMGTLDRLGTGNPWFPRYWLTCNCSWNATAPGCQNVSATVYKDCIRVDELSLFMDAFSAITLSLQKYLQTGPVYPFNHSAYFEYLRKISFDGINGRVQFGPNGVVQDGTFVITQMQGINAAGNYLEQQIGLWTSVAGVRNMTLDRSKLMWTDASIPPSMCVYECALNQYNVYFPSTCCWHCETCPEFTWPSNNSCLLLAPSPLSNGIQYGIIIVSVLGFCLVCCLLVLYWYYGEAPLIKASCREASLVCLVGVALNFITPLLFLPDPTPQLCSARRFVFSTALATVYVPVLIKCIKIVRVFSTRSVQQPTFITPKAQLIVILGFILLQVAMVAFSILATRPITVDVMPDRYAPLVERICLETPLSFTVMLLFDLMTLLSCAIMALRTRKLPENFNESSQIAFCVNTVLLLLIVLIPAFFSVQGAGTRAVILTAALDINGFVCLATLFAPKIYAVRFHVSAAMGPETQRNRPKFTTGLAQSAHSVHSQP